MLAAGCAPADSGPRTTAPPPAVAERPLSAEAERTVARFCGDCHPLPQAASFPRDRWPAEVRQGFDFYLTSLRGDLERPAEADAVRFFQRDAPEKLDIPRAADRPDEPAAVVFERMSLDDSFAVEDPAIASMLPRGDTGEILATDMRSGTVWRWRFTAAGVAADVVARAEHPCRLVPWPAEGPDAYLLADLGSYLPQDHDAGRVVAVDLATGTQRVLAAGLGRVVEAQPLGGASHGGDDIVVAEFGWRQTGSLRLLRREAAGGFTAEVFDPRHGALGVRITDLDGDGVRDVVAAFGQEYETVEVWWGRGDGGFDHERILALPDPSWGSSSFELADLDGDGRLDILHANGDTLDSGLAKPYHGIRRIMNRGDRRFETEEIGRMVGGCHAVAGDLDGDGDADVVACSLYRLAPSYPAGTFDSIVWYEWRDGRYLPHVVERDTCDHAGLLLADVDRDGRLDVIAGTLRGKATGTRLPPATVYLNRPRP